MPDDLDRLFERLVRVLAEDAPGRLAVLRLLSGERGYVSLDPGEVQEALRRETAEVNPDPGLFRQFPDAILSLNRLAAERFLRGDRAYAPPHAPLPDAPELVRPEEETEAEADGEAAGVTRQSGSAFELAEQSESPRQCPYCGETLPGGRKVNFCPQCGQPPRASCAVPRVAAKWTSAGATAPAAGARRASNDRRTVGLSDGRTVNTHPIAVIGGDGIGPEVIEAAIPVLERAAAKYGFGLELERLPYSADHYLKTRETLPDHAFRHLQDDVDAIFLGALGDPRVPGNEHARDILLGLRLRLDLYINFRPVKLLHPDLGVLRSDRSTVRTSDRPTIDFVIFRENTEGVYLGRGRIDGDQYIAEEVNTVKGVERIIRAAFEWAQARGKMRVTMSDKANAVPAHTVWQETFKRVAAAFP